MPTPIKVYWDSCVFIDWMKQDKPKRLPAIEKMVKEAEASQIMIVTSAFTLVEVVRTEAGLVVSPSDEQKIINFMKNDYIEVRPLDRKIAETSRYLQRTAAAAGMKMPKGDSIQLATAMSVTGLQALYTFDETDLVPHSGKWGNPPVTICLPPPPPPPAPVQQPLFGDQGARNLDLT